MKRIEKKTFGQERALYAVSDTEIENCLFAGEEDGESALKEARNICVHKCDFHLRYPFWHTERAKLCEVKMEKSCRAALWYAQNISMERCALLGIKAVRECKGVVLRGSEVESAEFGWFSRDITVEDSHLSGEYFFLHSENIILRNVNLKGKYSFQYCKNIEIYDSVLDTKDAFWETENVTVYNSTVKGEYLAWYAKNVRLVNCKIIGTQPLCYAQGIVLENCTMEGCDLCFEYSEIKAQILGAIDSVKNPLAGSKIVADEILEIILDENRRDGGKAEIRTKSKQL